MDRLDERLVGDRQLEDPLVRHPPVLHRLEALALVPRELEVDLAGGDDPRLSHLDDCARPSFFVLDDEAVAVLRRRILAVEPRSRRLLAREHRLDETAAKVGSRIPEAELRQLRHRTRPCNSLLLRGWGARSTWLWCQSVNASSPQSWRLRSSRPETWASRTRPT